MISVVGTWNHVFEVEANFAHVFFVYACPLLRFTDDDVGFVVDWHPARQVGIFAATVHVLHTDGFVNVFKVGVGQFESRLCRHSEPMGVVAA